MLNEIYYRKTYAYSRRDLHRKSIVIGDLKSAVCAVRKGSFCQISESTGTRDERETKNGSITLSSLSPSSLRLLSGRVLAYRQIEPCRGRNSSPQKRNLNRLPLQQQSQCVSICDSVARVGNRRLRPQTTTTRLRPIRKHRFARQRKSAFLSIIICCCDMNPEIFKLFTV